VCGRCTGLGVEVARGVFFVVLTGEIVGIFDLKDLSNATSMSLKSEHKFPLVYCDDVHGKESLGGALLSNLKQALSKIQSEDYEEDPENSDDDKKDQDSDKRLANMKTHVIMKGGIMCR
jgi:hypothetical protein